MSASRPFYAVLSSVAPRCMLRRGVRSGLRLGSAAGLQSHATRAATWRGALLDGVTRSFAARALSTSAGATGAPSLPKHSKLTMIKPRVAASGAPTATGEASGDGVADCGDTVALMLGWVGANHKQVAKYEAFYHRRGIPTLSVLPQPLHVIQPDSAVSFGAEILA